MHVLIGSQYYYPFEGGAEKQGRLLAYALIARDISVSYITSKLPKQPSYEDAGGIQIHRICPWSEFRPRRLRPVIYFFAVKRFLMLHGKQFDIYQSQIASDVTAPAMIEAAHKWKRPVVIRYASINELERLRSISVIGRKIDQSLLKADWNVTNSPHTFNIMTTTYGLPKERCQIIHNMIHSSGPITKINARKQLKIPVDAKIVLCISNFHPRKNQVRLIDAWPAVIKRVKNAQLFFVGTGNEERSCKSQVKRMGLSKSVFLCGYQTEVDLYLSAADIFVQPSSEEGQSNALIEAMAKGLPIAIANTPYNCFTIENGKEALTFDIKSTTSISNTLIDLLTDSSLAQNLGNAAQSRVFKEHDNNSIAEQYLQIYKKI